MRDEVVDCIEDARRVITRYVDHYNNVRLHSAIGYVAPMDKLNAKEEQIFTRRDGKMEAAREKHRQTRNEQSLANCDIIISEVSSSDVPATTSN